ncbi:hypothetical protein G3I39_09165 [Streptomyces fulvissimus]|uniref:Terminase small subunit n=1 Tax=Streptomyces microflavus TaxID=1919 RepID=A0A6N9V7M2_STRMI|nr:hypothetical protein [Streptomyces microflavus]NEB67218.1 hypothetical protein [Streptomyces microflavus]
MDSTALPEALGVEGSRLWHAVAGEFELRVDELRILEDACREADLIDRMHEEQQSLPLVVTGSMGQKVAAPLLQELRAHRALLARLLGSLKLPDEASDEAEAARERSSRARSAALARWGRAG